MSEEKDRELDEEVKQFVTDFEVMFNARYGSEAKISRLEFFTPVAHHKFKTGSCFNQWLGQLLLRRQKAEVK